MNKRVNIFQYEKKKTTYKRSGAKYSWNNNLVTGSLYCDLVLLLFLIKKNCSNCDKHQIYKTNNK